MNLRLHQIRVHSIQHPLTRALWLCAVLGILLAGLPRWETHRHMMSEPDHGHADAHLVSDHHDHADQAVTPVDSGDAAVEHVHALPALAMALTAWSMPRIEPQAVIAPDFADPQDLAPASLRPPPHRPPIV